VKYFKVFMDIDAKLIEQNTDTSAEEKAGELRAARQTSIRSETVTEETAGADYRALVQAKKNLKITNEKRAAELIHRDTPFRQFTDNMLKSSWENLISSFGLTLLWIDAHAFLNKVLGPKMFRDLGEEWVPASIKKLGDKKSKQAAALLKIAEGAGCGCLNLGCLLLVVSFFALSAMIVSAAINPWGTLWSVLFGDGSLSGFFDMIKSLW
jgi:hypothetical protein